jgi:hypothetical protein
MSRRKRKQKKTVKMPEKRPVMPDSCTILLCRHAGYEGTRGKPTDFLLGKLRPIVEKSKQEGKPVQLIHNHIPVLGVPDNIEPGAFEKILLNPKRRAGWYRDFKDWRKDATCGMSDASRGVDSRFVNSDYPELAFALEENQGSRLSIIHNLNFLPFEAPIEMTRAKMHYQAARRKANSGDYAGAMHEIRDANDACASAIMLKNDEMRKQLGDWDREGELVIMGSIMESTIVDMVQELGTKVRFAAEDVFPTFREIAVDRLLRGSFDMVLSLSMLDVIQSKIMSEKGLDWSDSDSLKHSYDEAIEIYKSCSKKIFGETGDSAK